MPWFVQVLICAFLIGTGLTVFFFPDGLLNLQMRFAQLKTRRTIMRACGIAYVLMGLLFVWAFTTYDFSGVRILILQS